MKSLPSIAKHAKYIEHILKIPFETGTHDMALPIRQDLIR